MKRTTGKTKASRRTKSDGARRRTSPGTSSAQASSEASTPTPAPHGEVFRAKHHPEPLNAQTLEVVKSLRRLTGVLVDGATDGLARGTYEATLRAVLVILLQLDNTLASAAAAAGE